MNIINVRVLLMLLTIALASVFLFTGAAVIGAFASPQMVNGDLASPASQVERPSPSAIENGAITLTITGPSTATMGQLVTYTIAYSGMFSTAGIQYEITTGITLGSFITTTVDPEPTYSPDSFTWPPIFPQASGTIILSGRHNDCGSVTHYVSMYDTHEDPVLGLPTDTAFTEVACTTTATAGNGGSLTHTDEDGNETNVEIPPGAVDQPTDFTFTRVTSPTQPSNLNFAGLSFNLAASQGGVPKPGLEFLKPVTITIEYSDADVAGMDENGLTLDYWDETLAKWVDAATTCTPPSAYDRNPAENWFSVAICHLSEFAVFEYHTLYLPQMNK